MHKPLISVIVPVYNAEKHLSRCIKSITSQTYEQLEILLINDGSTDNSAIICDEYQRLDKRIKVFNKSNGGVSSARNCGLENAVGEYIGFVDSDDWIDSNMYEILYLNLIEHCADISACEMYYDYDNSTLVNAKDGTIKVLECKEEMYDAALNPIFFSGYVCNKLFRKSLVEKVNGKNYPFSENVFQCEDLLFVSSYIYHSSRAVYTSKPLYHYNKGENNVDAKKYSNVNPRVLSLINAYDQLIDLYSVISPKHLNHLKLNYTKINMNLKYRLVKSDKDPVLLAKLDKNIKKYYIHVLTAENIRLRQKVNILATRLFPSVSGALKLFVKRHLDFLAIGKLNRN